MATITKQQVLFTYSTDAEDRADELEPYFEGVWLCEVSDRGDCYDVELDLATLHDGAVYFGKSGVEMKLTYELEKLASEWLRVKLAKSPSLVESLRAKCIAQFEKERDD